MKKLLICLSVTALLFACKKEKNPSVHEPQSVTIKYTENTDAFANPEKGFMHLIIANSVADSLNLNNMMVQRDQNITLVHRLYYLTEFRDKDIAADYLDMMSKDMEKVRRSGLKAILRFAYSNNIGEADASKERIISHINQLKTFFTNNKDVIAFVQAGFIGAWGEWHSSTNGLGTVDNQKAVLEALLAAVPGNIKIQLRTPGYKQNIYNTTTPVSKEQAQANAPIARVGHHNDCFLSDATDMGTYTNPTVEKTYISQEASYVPVGGETCPPSAGYSVGCDAARTQMQLLKWTYMNLDWYKPTVDGWNATGCFKEFQRNLGYRLVLLEGTFPKEVNAGGNIAFNLKLVNKGYAPVYNPKKMFLVLKSAANTYSFPVNYDVRDIKPLAQAEISAQVAATGVQKGDYKLYLKIADEETSLQERSEYSIRFSNTTGYVTDNGGLNDLNYTIKIN